MENNKLRDPHDIIGMGNILADDDDELDIDELEKSIVNGREFKKKVVDDIDISKEYAKELESISKQFGINDSGFNISSGFSSQSPSNNFMQKLPPQNTGKLPAGLSEESDDDDGDTEEEPRQSWSSSNPQDAQLNQMTTEERKQQHINNVLNNIEKNDDDSMFVQEEEEEDEMAKIMEQIDLLRTNLESEGENLTKIPEVTTSTSKKDASLILRMLQKKNDRLRYCDIFEEGILAVAYFLEDKFDGKKEWLGNKIDLVGWPDTVKVKLRRMRYNTSSFVGDVMKGYNIGHGWRILLELLPSLLLYSRDRRVKANDNLISDDKYKDALRELHLK
jgi:hypothetical protein